MHYISLSLYSISKSFKPINHRKESHYTDIMEAVCVFITICVFRLFSSFLTFIKLLMLVKVVACNRFFSYIDNQVKLVIRFKWEWRYKKVVLYKLFIVGHKGELVESCVFYELAYILYNPHIRYHFQNQNIINHHQSDQTKSKARAWYSSILTHKLAEQAVNYIHSNQF